MSTPEFTADCGHIIPALPDGHVGGTGYGIQGTSGLKMCYACCAAAESERMTLTGNGVLYLCYDIVKGGHQRGYKLTDWAGKLSFAVTNVKHSDGYGFGRRYDIVTGRFAGPDGKPWYFRNAGDSQIARCKRLK